MDIIAVQERGETLWHVVSKRRVLEVIPTAVLDARCMSSIEISKMISLQLIDKLPQTLCSVTIYGKEDTPRSRYTLEEALLQHFDCSIEIKKYHQSVAEVLCGDRSGIIATIGETSDMWRFDGSKVTDYNPSLGYIFGDKGSSTVLGKTLISALLTEKISTDVVNAFCMRFGIDMEWLLHQVQNDQLPKKFLSSLLPFINDHREEASIKKLINNTLEDYLRMDILPYSKGEEVHFIGEMTVLYDKLLSDMCQGLGIRMGKVLASVTDTLLSTHISQ
ncbi:hypothetical protein HQ35_05595 [Porphyromonas cangingivalis]|uniref:BadF-type ATPase n=1 Tax=Porphyromonas cangingivalis TaxID=36874 RepID=A0A0A2ENE5_PORCN|nr:hypothetical protein [Porphyromonas cangingivalis]KGN80438.1 hypothetical protein HQ35_05595 [Porphyromonas cangingivalis]